MLNKAAVTLLWCGIIAAGVTKPTVTSSSLATVQSKKNLKIPVGKETRVSVLQSRHPSKHPVVLLFTDVVEKNVFYFEALNPLEL